MKLKEGFITYESDGEHITVSAGGASFNGVIRSNSTAGFIVNALSEDTTMEAITEKMLEIYDAPKEIIYKDVEKIVSRLRSIGAIDE